MSLGIFYPNGHVEACLMYVWDINTLSPVVWDGAISGVITATVTNDGTFATPGKQDTGNASLATIAGKDFATQTTLALIKAKTDNIDVLLSTRTKPADQQHVIVDSGSITTGGLTDTQLRASAVPVSLSTLPALVAGTALIGKVGIDQTTPGTTNGVQVNAALPAGTAVIGNVKDAGYQNTTWAVHNLPSANTQATVTQASAGGSLKNVCLSLTVTLASSSTTAPAAVQLSVALIDGTSGGTTYLWRTVISLPAVAGAISSFNIKTPHGFEGTAATAMTLEFSVAGGANTIESVSMYGTTRL